jgi:hypothetical protein
MNRIIIVLAVVLSVSGAIYPQATAKEPKKADQDKTKRIRDLIDGLGNRGVVINDKTADAYLVIPKTFDWERCKHARDNIDKLMAMGMDAFPELISHHDDGRFCGFREGAIDRPTSVGDVCADIIESQVDVSSYDVYAPKVIGWVPPTIPRFGREITPGLSDSYESWKKSWDKGWDRWWKRSKDKSLRELQIKAAEDSITWLRKSKTDDPDFPSWQDKQVEGLKKMISQLKQSKKPKRGEFPYGLRVPDLNSVKKVGDEQRYYFYNGK